MLEGLTQQKQVSAGTQIPAYRCPKHNSSFSCQFTPSQTRSLDRTGTTSVGFTSQSAGFTKVSKNLLVDFSRGHRFRFKNEPVLRSGIHRSVTKREL